ncbi:MAG: YggT family protein, partial [Exiguobacterium sp.]
PFLAPFRRIIPPIGGMLDISPIVAFLVLNLAQSGIRAIFFV